MTVYQIINCVGRYLLLIVTFPIWGIVLCWLGVKALILKRKVARLERKNAAIREEIMMRNAAEDINRVLREMKFIRD